MMKRCAISLLLLSAVAVAQTSSRGVTESIPLRDTVLVEVSHMTLVIATRIVDLAFRPLKAGTLCFSATNQNDQQISFRVAGGAQIVRYSNCVPVTNGVAAAMWVPDPAQTMPLGILYHVAVSDKTTEILTYKLVSFSGALFDFDNYSPSPTQVLPPSGGSVNGPMSFHGDVSITGSCDGCEGVPGITMNLPQPTVGDDGLFQFKFTATILPQRLSCSTNTGTVVINLDVRTESAPNGPGELLLPVSLTCTSSATAVTTVFTMLTIPPNAPVALRLDSVVGDPGVVRIYFDGKPQ